MAQQPTTDVKPLSLAIGSSNKGEVKLVPQALPSNDINQCALIFLEGFGGNGTVNEIEVQFPGPDYWREKHSFDDALEKYNTLNNDPNSIIATERGDINPITKSDVIAMASMTVTENGEEAGKAVEDEIRLTTKGRIQGHTFHEKVIESAVNNCRKYLTEDEILAHESNIAVLHDIVNPNPNDLFALPILFQQLIDFCERPGHETTYCFGLTVNVGPMATYVKFLETLGLAHTVEVIEGTQEDGKTPPQLSTFFVNLIGLKPYLTGERNFRDDIREFNKSQKISHEV